MSWTFIPPEEIAARHKLNGAIRRVFGRSLHARHLDAGSCNGCDAELVATTNPVYDLQRLGIDIVASPRHADLLLVTGVVTRNLERALYETIRATPEPRIVVAIGACACSGGMFGESYASGGGVDRFVPVDVYVPGCPPRPQAILHGLLVAVGRAEQKMKAVRAGPM
jgi:Ni,Fe-hydrogenase III small subunit